ncbi:MAG TPA: FMN-binding protein [Firmicutes bacterium]|nr:FMN-binding protein [Bacillota bacterium]
MIRSRQSIKKNVLWCLGLLLVLVIFLTGCDQAGAKGKYTPGVYMAEAKGHNGVIEVEVTLSDSAITEVKVVSHSETSGVGDIALDRVSKSIVDKQTLAIDSISGASYSSRAILAAVEDCVTQAGGDATELKEE